MEEPSRNIPTLLCYTLFPDPSIFRESFVRIDILERPSLLRTALSQGLYSRVSHGLVGSTEKSSNYHESSSESLYRDS